MSMVVARIFGALVYLGFTLVWAGLMALVVGLKCDDSCSAGGDWTDNVHAWQYGAIGWLGAAGLALALIAVVLSLFRRHLGLAALAAHALVFTTNVVILLAGTGNGVPLVLLGPAAFAAAAGFVAVGGPRRPPAGARAA
jgi:hypothetical protein